MQTKLDPRSHSLLKALLLSVSFVIGTSIMGTFIFKSRQIPRNVTVRGLAEREVNATIGIWPISFRITEDDLVALQNKLEKQRKVITEFLHSQGFKQEELSYGIPDIEDKEAKSYTIDRKFRYVGQATITIRSSNIATVEKSLQKSEELIAKGIALENGWEYRPKFIFTKLNEIKPAMIQEATLEARKAAEQFAQDSGSQVGNICHATQGLFAIDDTHIPTKKHVRVVTTIQYVLVDK